MNFTCIRVCDVEGRGNSLSGQFFFVCEKDDREESSTKSLGGMTRPKAEMGSQTVSSESDISLPIHVYLSWNNNSQAQARRFPALTSPEPEFPVIFGSKWDPLTSAWRQGGASSERVAELYDRGHSSPETNFKVGLLPLFFMHLLLSHMFMVRTSPLSSFLVNFWLYLDSVSNLSFLFVLSIFFHPWQEFQSCASLRCIVNVMAMALKALRLAWCVEIECYLCPSISWSAHKTFLYKVNGPTLFLSFFLFF